MMLTLMDPAHISSGAREVELRKLFAAALRGGERELEALIERVQPRVYALARAIVRRADWAEDVTQDTLLRMVEKLPELQAIEYFDMWLLCLARNTAISLLRKHRVRDEYAPPPETLEVPSPAELAIAQEELGRIVQRIDRLPPALREVLVLRYFHHLECAEIGRIVGSSTVAVRVRIYRAVQELRARLADEEQP